MKTFQASLVLGVCLFIGCSWPIGAEHPHRFEINSSINDNPRTRPSLRSEWRQKLGLKGAFVTSQGFIGGVAVHKQYPLVALAGFDNDLLFYNRVSGNLLWREKLKSSGVGSPFAYFVNGAEGRLLTLEQ